ncbi:MAG: Fe-S cluster assembly protein SufD [Geminicoccaceae bacterium]
MVAFRHVEPVPALAELWAGSRGYLPGKGPVAAARQRRFDAFMATGIPTRRVEAWKYTDIAKWANRPLALPPRVTPGADRVAAWFAGGPRARRLIFVNGHIQPELCHVGGLPKGVTLRGLGRAIEDDPERAAQALGEGDAGRSLSDLNAAFATSGAWIELADGVTLDEPVQLLFLTLGEPGHAVMASPRNLVRLGRNARLRLIETHVALGEGPCLTNLVTALSLAEGAELVHDRLELGRDATGLVGRIEGTLAAKARLQATTVTLGGGLVRNEAELKLQGTGIEALLNGLYMPTGTEHVDTQLRLVHEAPGCHSNQFYKGVVDGRSHAVFSGKIMVERAAQKTDAYQSNANLLLSDDAEIDTRPELEIYADDVKCSHGATVGDLDPVALFYLRSRGLPLDDARGLLVYGWANEVIERMGDDTARAQARKAVQARLPGRIALDLPA